MWCNLVDLGDQLLSGGCCPVSPETRNKLVLYLTLLACVLLYCTSVVMWCHVTSLPQVWRQWAYFGEPLENLEWGSSGGSWRWTQVRGSAPRGPNISPEIWNWLRGFMWTFRAMQFSQTIGKIRSTVTFSLQTPAVMEVSGMAFSCTFSLKVQLDRPCFLSDVFAKYIVIVLPSACVVKYLWNSLSPLSSLILRVLWFRGLLSVWCCRSRETVLQRVAWASADCQVLWAPHLHPRQLVSLSLSLSFFSFFLTCVAAHHLMLLKSF